MSGFSARNLQLKASFKTIVSPYAMQRRRCPFRIDALTIEITLFFSSLRNFIGVHIISNKCVVNSLTLLRCRILKQMMCLVALRIAILPTT